MIRFVRIIRDAGTWPVRHAVISILIVCLSIVYAVGHVSYLKTMRILYYQGDQLREQDLYGVWKIEKSSAEFLKEKFTEPKSFSDGEYIETNLWICLMPGNWCVHNCYVDYYPPNWFSRTQSRIVRQKLLFTEPIGTAERERVAERLITNSRSLPDAEKIALTLEKWRRGERCEFDFFQRWVIRTNNSEEISYRDEFNYGEAGKRWIKYTVRLEGLATANDGAACYLDPAFIFIGKDEKGFFLWMPVPWTYDGIFLPGSLEGENVVFRKAAAEVYDG